MGVAQRVEKIGHNNGVALGNDGVAVRFDCVTECQNNVLFSDPNKVIRTEMTLVPEEFDNYQIGVDTEVTFCLKELRVSSLITGLFVKVKSMIE